MTGTNLSFHTRRDHIGHRGLFHRSMALLSHQLRQGINAGDLLRRFLAEHGRRRALVNRLEKAELYRAGL